MLIGELAEHIGTSPRSLRHYEQQGLLEPARDANGYRVYDDVAVIRAANIRDLLDTGLTTADVLQYDRRDCLDRPLADSPRCTGEIETARRRLETLDQLIARLQRTRDRLAEQSGTLETGAGPR